MNNNKKAISLGLVDKTTYMHILGGIMEKPGLLDDHEDIRENDFSHYRIASVIFKAINELRVANGNAKNENSITANSIESQISMYPAVYEQFTDHGGLDFLSDCVEYGMTAVSQFEMHYNRLKKLSLLRALNEADYDISHYYKEEYPTLKEEKETVERFDEATPNDILDYIEGNFQTIRSQFVQSNHSETDAAYQIEELVEEYKKTPDIGPDLSGKWFNTAVRGARAGKYYLKSAPTNCGKSRTSIFDACKICYPIYYSHAKQGFVHTLDAHGNPVIPRKVLFIVTEMDNKEIQTTMLAYLAGVEESLIKMGNYSEEIEWRVKQAARIIKKYSGYFRIEAISDPNLTNISNMIKRYATVEQIQYVFFDYIHSTPSLINQFSSSKIREDVALMMLSTQLKQLAKDYNLFVFSATQVNSEGIANEDNTGFHNEACIRGAKSIADKADVGYIMSLVTEKEYQSLMQKLASYRDPITGQGYKSDSEEIKKIPNVVLDIYKNRGGQYKNVRIWAKLDLGTGEREDLYITWKDNTPLPENMQPLAMSAEEIDIEWNTMPDDNI